MTSLRKALYIVKLGKHVLKLLDSAISLSSSAFPSDCSQRATSSGHDGATARTSCILRGPQVFASHLILGTTTPSLGVEGGSRNRTLDRNRAMSLCLYTSAKFTGRARSRPSNLRPSRIRESCDRVVEIHGRRRVGKRAGLRGTGIKTFCSRHNLIISNRNQGWQRA